MMNDNEQELFSLGTMYGLAQAGDWDKVDDLLEVIDPDLWLNTDQFSNIQQVRIYLNDKGIDI